MADNAVNGPLPNNEQIDCIYIFHSSEESGLLNVYTPLGSLSATVVEITGSPIISKSYSGIRQLLNADATMNY